MGKPRWPGFDSKTGDPQFDNMSANLNRRIWRFTAERMRFDNVIGRKRKKHLKRVEGAHFVHLATAVLNDKLKEQTR